MGFKNLDLNLIVTLDVLLKTRSVSRAAERLHLSQPAMSAALSRLRAYFDDDLLVLSGRRMIPTAYAESLVPIIADILGGVETLVATSAGFDPATSQRHFRLGASDYISLVVITPFLQSLARLAPGITIEIVAPSEEMVQQLERGELDLMLTPDGFLSAHHPAELLFEENHVVIGWAENPVFNSKLTEEAFFAHGHIVVQIGQVRNTTFADRQMDRLGLRRRIEVSAPSFLAVPWMLPRTFRLALIHERLARVVTPVLPLRVVPPPFDFAPMREMLQFHITRKNDAGLRWLIEQLRAAATD